MLVQSLLCDLNSENDVHLKILNILSKELFVRSFFSRHGMRIWSGSKVVGYTGKGCRNYSTKKTGGEDIFRDRKGSVDFFRKELVGFGCNQDNYLLKNWPRPFNH